MTLRVPPARLREVNRSIELAAWKAFRTEIYATYDFKEAAKAQRERAALMHCDLDISEAFVDQAIAVLRSIAARGE